MLNDWIKVYVLLITHIELNNESSYSFKSLSLSVLLRVIDAYSTVRVAY